MRAPETRKVLRCAVYTRVSTEYGLEQEFNSLDAQRESSEAYVKSQAHEGWRCLPTQYNDGGFSGGSLNRPALQKLLSDIRSAVPQGHDQAEPALQWHRSGRHSLRQGLSRLSPAKPRLYRRHRPQGEALYRRTPCHSRSAPLRGGAGDT